MAGTLLALFLFSTGAIAGDWPQWRGPDRNGISPETGLLDSWPQQGPRLLWHRANIGSGYSTPAVVGERIFLVSNEGMENEFVQALSTRDGQRLWSTRIGKVGPNEGPQYPGARSTPTVEGDWLYALGSDGDLVCLETATGKLRWRKNLRSDFGGTPGNWAYAESPLIDGERLICSPGGIDATLVALNKETGDLIWKSPVPGGDPAAYASAIKVEAGGIPQYVQFLHSGLAGVEATTGKFLWRYDRTAQGSPANIPTPLVDGDYIYNATSRGGGALIQLQVADGMVDVKEIYRGSKLPVTIGGAVKVGDHLYGTTSKLLLCLEFLSGELVWEAPAIGAGSLVYADGHIYIHGETGGLALVEATPEEYREKGRFTPVDQPERGRARAWTYPVIAQGRLYLHDLGTIWCYDIQASTASTR